MAANLQSLNPRIADRRMILTAAVGFPLLVLLGYFRTYYGRAFFDVPAIANSLVHAHALVMSAWVLYFVAQVALIRSKNVKLHMTMGFAGRGLALIVIVVGMATAVDSHLIRGTAPAGINPHGFFAIPVFDMALFAVFFAGAIYYRKRPTEHKALMLMTAINFLPAAVARLPLLPEDMIIIQAYAIPDVFALLALGWHTWKHRKLNKVFALAVLLFVASHPLRIVLAGTQAWLSTIAWLAG